MTAVRTKFEAGCYAVTASSQKILILDRFKKITVASVDDFNILFDAMRIDPEKYLSIENLNNACILYAMSVEFGVEPGMFLEGDKALIAFCRSRISDDVVPDDVNMLLNELTLSWQLVAEHPLLKKYIQLGEYIKTDELGCKFSPIGAFELFIHDYLAGCVRAFVNQRANDLSLLKEWTYLVFSTMHGFGLRNNRFVKMELFLDKVKCILDETGQNRLSVIDFLAKIKKDYDVFKSMWFVTIRDWAKIELEDIETLDGAGDHLTDLLENRVVENIGKEIQFHLKDLHEQLSFQETEINPLMKSCDFSNISTDHVLLNKLIKEVIIYAIESYALENDITLYQVPLEESDPLFRKAGRGEGAEEELVKYLLPLDDNSHFLPYELYAIAKKARSVTLKEVVSSVVIARAKQEEFINSCSLLANLGLAAIPSRVVINAVCEQGAPITYQYRHLQRVLDGKHPRAYPMIQSSAAASSSSAKPEENLHDALYETMNLQKSDGCILF